MPTISIFMRARCRPMAPRHRRMTGHVELCVGKQNFIVPSAGRGCSRAGQQLVRFTEVKPYPSESGWTAYLAEESDYNDEQARLAGCAAAADDQRL